MTIDTRCDNSKVREKEDTDMADIADLKIQEMKSKRELLEAKVDRTIQELSKVYSELLSIESLLEIPLFDRAEIKFEYVKYFLDRHAK